MKVFLERQGISSEYLVKVMVRREQPLYVDENGRKQTRFLDLLVTLTSSTGAAWGIGIENKFGAGDLNRQVADYCNWLEIKFAGNCTLLYWTPQGGFPAEQSVTEEECRTRFGKTLKVLSHIEDTIELIREWISLTRPDRVRHFLQDFENFLHHRLNGSIFMNDNKTIQDFVLDDKSANRIRLVCAVRPAVDDIIDKVLEAFEKTQLSRLNPDLPVKVGEYNMNRWEKESGFELIPTAYEGAGLSIRFWWGEKYYKVGYISIEMSKVSDDVVNQLHQHLGEADRSGISWSTPWFKRMSDEYFKFNEATYADLHDGTFIRYVEKELEAILAGLANVKF